MPEIKEKGIEIFKGFTIPWDWIDGFAIGLIDKGGEAIEDLAEKSVATVDDVLQALVDKTVCKFDNHGKEKVAKAFTLAMVKKFMPELLNPPE